jgi:hypothetical protein
MEENIDMVKKVLDHLVFKPNVLKYEIYTDDVEGEFTLSFDIFVDLGRYFEFSDQYDKNYHNLIRHIEEKIFSTLRYVNMQNYFTDLHYNYENKEVFYEKINEINKILFLKLKKDYNINKEEIVESEIYFDPIFTEGTNPYILVNMYGSEVLYPNNEGTKISCRQLIDVMYNIIIESHIEEYEFVTTSNRICT